MDPNAVCAVIVTFRPKAEVLQNLAKVRQQVKGLVVIDNGSSPEALAPLRQATADLDFTLIENSENLGIAAALNIGVRWAQCQVYKWVVLFDQDSTVRDGLIHCMQSAYNSSLQRDRVAIISPLKIEKSSEGTKGTEGVHEKETLTTITSGSLIPAWVFEECGLFEEDLIIDCVDHEYCLRVRSLGYTLLQCLEVALLVSVGDMHEHRVLGMRLSATHHSAQRRYYMTRNRLVIIARYWKRYPEWCRQKLRFLIKDSIIVCLFEEQRGRKLTNMARGFLDAMRGRMGMVVNL